MSARRPVALPVWSAAVLVLGAAPFLAAYRPGTTAVVLAVVVTAVAVPFAVVALGERLRVPRWVVAAATTSVVVAAALGLLRGAEPAAAAESWRTAPAGRLLGPLLDSVARLLTGPRPAGATPETLAPVGVLVAVVALGVALATVRRRRPGAAPLVGAAVLYAAALLLTAGEADPHGLLAAGVLTVTVLGWLLLDGADDPSTATPRPSLGRPGGRRRRTWRGWGGHLVAVAGAATVAVVVAGSAPADRAFEPREHVTPPRVDLAAGHPLSQLPVWTAQGDHELFRVTGTVPDRLALVVLPDFDGATWRAGLELRPVGAVASSALPDGDVRGRAEATVVPTGLRDAGPAVGAWLPTTGDVTEISVPALADAETGSVMAADGVPGEPGYRFVAEVDQPAPATIARAAVPTGPTVARYLEVPRLPADLRDFARTATSGATSRWAQVVALREAVRAERDLAPDAVTGSSYARLREFLGAPRAEGGQVGSAEQFASSFAVLARAVGVPTRLVVGFRLPGADDDGTMTVRGRDAHVWPEVYLAGAGWVPVEPTPADASGDSGRGRGTAPEDVPVPPPPPPAAGEGEGAGTPPETVETDDGADDHTAGDAVVVGVVVATAAAGVGGAAVLVVLVLAGLRASRTRRLRGQGAVGAWQHVEDALVLAGARPRAHEDARAVARRHGGDDLAVLAERAEAAAFAPEQGGADDDAWDRARRAVAVLRRATPWHRRLAWPADPAPLRRRRPPTGGHRVTQVTSDAP